MIDFITTNPIDDFTSVKDKYDNFIICHYYQTESKVTAVRQMIDHFVVYYQDGMDTSEIENYQENYASNSTSKFRFVPVAFMSEALDKIVKKVGNRVESYKETRDEEDDDELDVQVICATETDVARGFNSYMNKKFRENLVEAESISLLQYSKIVNLDQLADTMKKLFNTDFIYPNDPLQFAYVSRKFVEGYY